MGGKKKKSKNLVCPHKRKISRKNIYFFLLKIFSILRVVFYFYDRITKKKY